MYSIMNSDIRHVPTCTLMHKIRDVTEYVMSHAWLKQFHVLVHMIIKAFTQ